MSDFSHFSGCPSLLQEERNPQPNLWSTHIFRAEAQGLPWLPHAWVPGSGWGSPWAAGLAPAEAPAAPTPRAQDAVIAVSLPASPPTEDIQGLKPSLWSLSCPPIWRNLPIFGVGRASCKLPLAALAHVSMPIYFAPSNFPPPLHPVLPKFCSGS